MTTLLKMGHYIVHPLIQTFIFLFNSYPEYIDFNDPHLTIQLGLISDLISSTDLVLSKSVESHSILFSSAKFSSILNQ